MSFYIYKEVLKMNNLLRMIDKINQMEFSTLYGTSVTGKKKVWNVRVIEKENGGAIITTHGYEGMKMVTNERLVTKGKNIGKKNETTPLQQAISEARADWNKKKDAGYKEEGTSNPISEIAPSKAKEITEEANLPMLALDFHKRGKSIKFPCYVQPKLDGTRSVGVPGLGLFSRNRKHYPHLEHIKEEMLELKGFLGEAQLDGELYSDTLSFQEIVGLVKKETLTESDKIKQKEIYYHVYDLVNNKSYEERMKMLEEMFRKFSPRYIHPVKTEKCPVKEDLHSYFLKYIDSGYEGLMIRNREGLYKINGRSADLQKYKLFEDKEYEITDFKEGDGVEKGLVIWICKTEDGKTFSVRPKGSHKERGEMFQNGREQIGKMLTVKYQELTNDGIPRFPVGITIRDYE